MSINKGKIPVTAADKITESKNTLVLKSSDEQEFEVEQSIAMLSKMIKDLVDDGCTISVIPVPNIDSKTLIKVIEYFKGHVDSNTSKHDLDEFNKIYLQSVIDPENDRAVLDLVKAANYLEIRELLDLTCNHVADLIKNKTVEEIRQYFNLENDYTAEEEAAIRAENNWTFDQ